MEPVRADPIRLGLDLCLYQRTNSMCQGNHWFSVLENKPNSPVTTICSFGRELGFCQISVSAVPLTRGARALVEEQISTQSNKINAHRLHVPLNPFNTRGVLRRAGESDLGFRGLKKGQLRAPVSADLFAHRTRARCSSEIEYRSGPQRVQRLYVQANPKPQPCTHPP